ncbi:MAG: flagellar export protein FliJ [Nitrospinae bacterium]|nr:flagellar export protein FliJ [Nitrospinota bacterium]MZH03861.1 flagellar export protein FliJ [Nitrospinota bacterium]MZH15321.1 flagellar export protein FliJ [Nitrospinota bacterium]
MGFRFETILKLNKNKEDLLQKDMGQINALIQKQQDSQDFMKEIMENKKEELNQKKRGNIDIQTMILYDNFFSGTQIHKKRQETIISEISVKLEEKRKEVIDAMRKRRTLEILKDRQMLKESKLRDKKLLAIQDENASSLWARNH